MKRFVCLYAGDKEDEYCGVCDGIMAAMANGESVPAVQCPGFEPSETEIPDDDTSEEVVEAADAVEEQPVKEVAEEPVEETVEEAVVEKEPEPVKEKAKAKPVKKETKKDTQEVKKEVKTEIKTVEDVKAISQFNEVVEIRVDSGISFDAGNNNWFKLNYGETRRVCGSDEYLESVRQDMWNKANSEVDTQMGEILADLNLTK